MATGGKMPGIAVDASSASTTGPSADPALLAVGQRRRHHLERDLRVLEPLEVDAGVDDLAEAAIGVHGRAMLEEHPRPVHTAREDGLAGQVPPDVVELLDPSAVREPQTRRR